MKACQRRVHRGTGEVPALVGSSKRTSGYWGKLGEALTTVHSFGFLLLLFVKFLLRSSSLCVLLRVEFEPCKPHSAPVLHIQIARP